MRARLPAYMLPGYSAGFFHGLCVGGLFGAAAMLVLRLIVAA